VGHIHYFVIQENLGTLGTDGAVKQLKLTSFLTIALKRTKKRL